MKLTPQERAARKPDGSVSVYLGIKVDMAEVEKWKPEVVAAFFEGIARVLAAGRAAEIVRETR